MKRHRRPIAVLVTCEHGGNRVPARYARWFAGSSELLATHRGYDDGALQTARFLARMLHAPLIASTISRLVVDLNRSPGHPRWFGEALRDAPGDVRDDILARVYEPYRRHVGATIESMLARGDRVVHVASHSFTPVLDGDVRRCDIGLLFDPSRRFERNIAARWQQSLSRALPGAVVRRNYPYRGISNGLPTALRRRYADADYAGLELEVNQARLRDPAFGAIQRALAETLRTALAGISAPGTPARAPASPVHSRAVP